MEEKSFPFLCLELPNRSPSQRGTVVTVQEESRVCWNASKPCPASQIIDQEETPAFQKLSPKCTEPAQLPCVTGAVFIRGFSGAFSRAGSPRRDPGRISQRSDSRSHIMGIGAGFNILHFSTLIHATPGE